MKRISSLILCCVVTALLFSCTSARYVPFTRDLRAKLESQNVDLRQVQFYIDQKLVLSRNLGEQKVEVHSGIVKLQNGIYSNDIIIPAFTPGVCDAVDNDKLMISFENGNNDLAFGPGSGFNTNQYVLYGTEWRNGTAAVVYDSNKFRAACGTCADVARATLVIRKSVLDKIQSKSRTVSGRTVSSTH